MKILHLLPEFNEGGVERHTLLLADELICRGHHICVISSGGSLEALLDSRAEKKHLPVHRKNPLTALHCALRIAGEIRTGRWQLIHAHSRVPAWIAWCAGRITGTPSVYTAHARYSLNHALIPLRHADAAICVSHAVQNHLSGYLPSGHCRVIYNALPGNPLPRHAAPPPPWKLLCVGRLTRLKGIHVLLEALAGMEGDWSLDIVGDGPMRAELEDSAAAKGIDGRVTFHGFRRDAEAWLSRCSLFLFPSLDEGMGLSLMQALRAGCPVLASDIEAVRELVKTREGLVAPGNAGAWRAALHSVLAGREAPVYSVSLPEPRTMALETEALYAEILKKRG